MNRITAWKNNIAENTELFEKSFSDLDEKQINWKADSKNWSIGQVIEHLIKTSESYFAIPEKINSKDFKPSLLTKFKFAPKLFGKMILKAVDPNTKLKSKTMGSFTPEMSNVPVDILDKFKESQKQLLNFIEENKELILNKTVVPSPINRHITYHFDTVIDILVNHQRRHFNQAERVMELWSKNES